MKNNLKETIVAVLLVVLAVLVLNPFNFWMPSMLVLCMLAIILGLFGLFASFILRETVTDEREGMHRTLAGRNAFLAGACVLIVAIVVQTYSKTLDPWLVITLVVMVVVKILTRMWTDKNL